jgi:hypothetical protein
MPTGMQVVERRRMPKPRGITQRYNILNPFPLRGKVRMGGYTIHFII